MKKILCVFLSVLMLAVSLPSLSAFAQGGGAPASSVSNPTMVVGGSHVLILKETGTVWGWGSNGSGELGDGTLTDRVAPVQTLNLYDVKRIATNIFSSFALKNDGTIWGWGEDNNVIFHNENESSLVRYPVQMNGFSGGVEIDAGFEFCVILKKDGTVWTFGYNYQGQLGNGNNKSQKKPVQVLGLTNVVAITAGEGHAMALKKDGTVWAWGYNDYGQLGDGTRVNKNKPVQVKGLSGMVSISASSRQSMALKKDGTVWMWGCNQYGQLGNGQAEQVDGHSVSPVQVKGLTGVKSISAGSYHSMALKTNGTVFTWGHNRCGELGDGTLKPRYTPVQVKNLKRVVEIGAGSGLSTAIKEDGTFWAWGSNEAGSLGDGMGGDRDAYSAVPVQRVDGKNSTAAFNVMPSKTGRHVSMRIGRTKAVQNGVLNTIDQWNTKPFTLKNKTMVPMRFVAEKMGAKVTYTSNKKPIVVSYGKIVLKVTLGAKFMEINNNGVKTKKALDVPALTKNGKTFFPLRAIGEALGFQVYYDNPTGIILVSNPKMSPTLRSELLSEAKALLR